MLIVAASVFVAIIGVLCLAQTEPLREQNRLLRQQNDELALMIDTLSWSTEFLVNRKDQLVMLADRVGRPVGVAMGGRKP